MSTVQVVAKEELLDQQVTYFLAMNPQVKQRHSFIRRPNGCFAVDDSEVTLEWQASTESGRPGWLAVVRGHMRLPLLDYIHELEDADFVNQAIAVATNSLTKDKGMSFNDTGEAYSRLDAMKVAKEQALVREKAAGYLQAGKALPEDIMDNYRKSLQKKLAPVSIRKLRERGGCHDMSGVGITI